MATGTRRRSAAEWRGLVQEWQKSGQTREAFAEARGLRPTTLGWWASELARRSRPPLVVDKKRSVRQEQPTFLPVRVVDGAPRARAAVAVAPRAVERREDCAEIVLGGGRVLRVPVGADVAWVAQVATALQEGERC